jgi:hypothetical protein
MGRPFTNYFMCLMDKGWREKRIREAETAFDGAVELGKLAAC